MRVVQRGQCSTPDDFVGAVENLCIIRARFETSLVQPTSPLAHGPNKKGRKVVRPCNHKPR